MKYSIILLPLCVSALGNVIPKDSTKYRARITYYSDNTAKVADPNTKLARTGITVAAHPKFKFGSRLFIPALTKIYDGDGIFKVQDRGPAVTSRKASRGKTEVIDVYVSSVKDLRKFAYSFPQYMDVYVLE